MICEMSKLQFEKINRSRDAIPYTLVHSTMMESLSRAILLLSVVMVTTDAATERQVVTVNSKIGTINGYVQDTTFLDKTFPVDRFLGIPYAEAPIGERRFKKSLAKVPLSEPLDAFKHGSMCMQLSFMESLFPDTEFNYSEDCLFLNVYAPHERNLDDKLAVMVWFYGGGFNVGFTDSYLGDNIAAHGNVIVVTVNYRLCLWGFLSTGNEHAPGNAGLWDQHMAIKWVSENIGTFGGDNQRITVFGESAGSASVFYQALFPGNKGLFQRVIGQSGTVDSTWASNEKVTEYSSRLASLVDCKDDNSKEAVECLQLASSDRLLEIGSNASLGFLDLPFPFSPTRDDEFVTYDPRYAFYGSNELSAEVIDMFRSVDIMTGVNTAEGSIALSPLFGIVDISDFFPNNTEFEELVESTVTRFFKRDDNFQLLVDLIKAEYTDWINPEDSVAIRNKYVEMHGDVSFVAPTYNTLNRHVQESTTSSYMYVFGEAPSTPLFTDNPWLKGVAHAEELVFVFGYKSFSGDGDRNGTEWEKLLARDVITMWSNFAKSGNPNKPVDLDLDWLPYSQKHQHYLHITRDLTSQSVKQRYRAREAYFWNEIVPKIVKGDTWSSSEQNDDQKGTCEKDGSCGP